MSRKTARNRDRVPDVAHIVRQRHDRAKRWWLAARLLQYMRETDKTAQMPFVNRKTHRAFMASK